MEPGLPPINIITIVSNFPAFDNAAVSTELNPAVLGVTEEKLAFRFVPQFGPIKGIYFSVFHAVSAFCNGGFDLMGTNEAYSSLVAFEGDVLVNLVIVTLIIVGGIGFIVWDDVARNKWHFKRYLLHSKIVPVTQVAEVAVKSAFRKFP